MAGYIIKAQLEYTEPLVWRRMVIPDRISLLDLHTILQCVFDWYDGHPHEFRELRSKEKWIDESEEGIISLQRFMRPKKVLMYTYDFGDYWVHRITFERKAPDYQARCAKVLEYEGDNFMEDCGGVWYGQESDENRVQFDLEAMNRRLSCWKIPVFREESLDPEVESAVLEHGGESGQVTENDSMSHAKNGCNSRNELKDEHLSSAITELVNSLTSKELNQLNDFLEVLKQRLDSNPTETLKWLSDLDSMDEEKPESEMLWRAWAWVDRDEEMDIVKTMSRRSVRELLGGMDDDELKDLCKFFRFQDLGDRSENLNALRSHLTESPQDLTYVFSLEEIHALRGFFAKPVGICGELPDIDTIHKAIRLGMLDVGEEKVNRRQYFAIKQAKDALEILEALSEEEWKSACEKSEQVQRNCFNLLWIYFVMDLPSFCAKYREYYDSAASDDDILRCVYLSGTFCAELITALTEDNTSYVSDNSVDLDHILNLWQQEGIWEMEYRPMSQEELDDAESGYCDQFPDWQWFDNYLYAYKAGDGVDTDEWLLKMYYDVLNGASVADLWAYFLDDETLGIDEYKILWEDIIGVYLNTGLPQYKGYSRAEYAQKKGIPILDFFCDEEYVNEITRQTHLYEMPPEFQLRLFEIIHNKDYPKQKRELQAVLRDFSDGNAEIEYLLSICLFNLGDFREQRNCLKRLVKEYPENDRLADLLKSVKHKIQEQDAWEKEKRRQEEPSIWDMLEDMENGKFPKSDTTTYRRIQPKVGRNDPCPCGSGKKYKKCCGR